MHWEIVVISDTTSIGKTWWDMSQEKSEKLLAISIKLVLKGLSSIRNSPLSKKQLMGPLEGYSRVRNSLIMEVLLHRMITVRLVDEEGLLILGTQHHTVSAVSPIEN